MTLFRINELGSYLLGLTDRYAGPATPVGQPILKVLPNLDVIVADRTGLPPNDRAILERFTTRAREDAHKLSRDRLPDAAESGFGIADAEGFLHRRSQHELPPTVTTLFQDATRGDAAIQSTSTALLIQCADSLIAQLIAHDNVLGKLCLPAGETQVVAPDKQLAAFRRGLRELGFVLSDQGLGPGARTRKTRS